ncbi:inaD-like protein isoform X1 [Silurus meridionalis]|nr:inaD-like protein isoform X1 [Silurus meridionalis]
MISLRSQQAGYVAYYACTPEKEKLFLQLNVSHNTGQDGRENPEALRCQQCSVSGALCSLVSAEMEDTCQLNCIPPDACSEFGFSKKGQLIVSASRPGSSLGSVVSSGTAVSSASSEQLQRWLHVNAKGRTLEYVSLLRPLTGGLGFSVVGLRPDGVGSHGVFVKQVQFGSVADRDGRLQENDQILAINGIPLDQNVTQQQAIAYLQQQRDRVELVVAKESLLKPHLPPSGSIQTEQWAHVEEIELMNDGSGLGFGIVGGKAAGVVVRTLVPNSVADKDGRMRTGDHILRIGDTPTQGLTSEQVVQALQACGTRVRMLIARDPVGSAQPPPPPPHAPTAAPVTSMLPPIPARRTSKTLNLEGHEIHEVLLKKKDGQSLGISIVGCNTANCDDGLGVSVKSIIPGSAAEQCGNIMVHDRIIALNGVNLQGFTSQEVLDVMRQTGQNVNLTLVRKITSPLKSPVEISLDKGKLQAWPTDQSLYRHKMDKMQREPSRVSLRRSAEIKVRADVQMASMMEPADTSQTAIKQPSSARVLEPIPLTEMELRTKWEQALGPQYDVMVVELDPVIEDDAELQKYSKLLPIHTMRLGVELDSFDGHHYISTVAPDGPVAKHGLLRPEDELLEVNGVQLYGKTRREAVAFLREVPPPFTLVCCRRLTEEGIEYQPDDEWSSDSPTASLQEQTQVIQNEVAEQRTAPEQSYAEKKEEEVEEEDENKESGDEELALWSPEVHVLELEKSERGLGFSILDYQDPLDTTRFVIVIRSLVAGGVAENHGGLLPGDQLVFVNDTYLDMCPLSQAVDVLKAAPPGKVYLGIRKPLGADDSNTMEKPKDLKEQEQTPSHPQLHMSKTVGLAISECKNLALLKRRTSGDMKVEREKGYDEGIEQGFGNDALPEDIDDDDDDDPELILESTIRYVKPRITPELLSGEEREMAVDEEEDEDDEEERNGLRGDSPSLYHREQSPFTEEEPMTNPYQTFTKAEMQQVEVDIDNDVPEEDFGSELESSLNFHQHALSQSTRTWLELAESEVDSDSRNEGSELTLTDTDTESAHQPLYGRRKKRGQGASTGLMRDEQSDLPEREDGEGEETPIFSHWGPPRRVEVWLDPGESLGISIVGGRSVIKRLKNGEELKGIFIKQVLPDSPAGRTRALKTGDKILQVAGVDLQNASHEEAVQAIKNSQSPVEFIVQSLSSTPRPVSVTASSIGQHKAKRNGELKPEQRIAPPPMRLPPPYRPPSLVQEEDDGEEDREDIRQKYSDLQGELLLVELEKDRQGLGLSLAGNRDRSCMSIFVVGINPGGTAGRDGRIRVGDELLEINNQVLYGRSHQNASAIIKSAASKVKLVLLRNEDAINQMAVPPFPYQPSFLSSNEIHPSLPEAVTPTEKPQPPECLPEPLVNQVQEQSCEASPESSGPVETVDKGLQDGEAASKAKRTLEVVAEDVSRSPLEKTPSLANSQRNFSKLPATSVDVAALLPPVPPSSTSPDFECCSKGTSLISCVPPEHIGHIQGSLNGIQVLLLWLKQRRYHHLNGMERFEEDAIVIHEVYEEGAAARDGRLWAGDQILEVNGVDLRSVAHEDAIAALRQTPAKVRLTVLRDEAQYRDEENLDIFSVELQKKSGRGLGLSIVGKRNGTGVFISDVVKGGAADVDGRLMQGDQILSVDGEDMRRASQETVAAVLKCARGMVQLELGRLKAASWITSRRTSQGSQVCKPGSGSSLHSALLALHVFPFDTLQTLTTNAKPSCGPDHHLDTAWSTMGLNSHTCNMTNSIPAAPVAPPTAPQLSHLPSSTEKTGTEANTKSSVVETGLRRVEITRVGDRIVSINSQSLEGLTHGEVVTMLKNAYGNITLQVIADTNISAIASQVESMSSSSTLSTNPEALITDPETPKPKSITLEKGSEGLGFSIVGGFGSPHGDLPIYVKTVFCKRIHEEVLAKTTFCVGFSLEHIRHVSDSACTEL